MRNIYELSGALENSEKRLEHLRAQQRSLMRLEKRILVKKQKLFFFLIFHLKHLKQGFE